MRPDREGPTTEGRTHEHQTPFSLAAELDELGREETLAVCVRVAGCRGCQGALERLVHWLEELDHWRPAVGPEYLTRHGFFESLLATSESHAQRIETAQSEAIFHHWGLGRLLLEESQRMRSRDLRFAIELGELAWEIAERLDDEYYSSPWVADLRALSSAQLADSLRRFGRTDQAEEAFGRSRVWLRSGTDRARIRGLVDGLEALLFREQGRESESWFLVERSVEVLESPWIGLGHSPWNRLVDRREVAACGP